MAIGSEPLPLAVAKARTFSYYAVARHLSHTRCDQGNCTKSTFERKRLVGGGAGTTTLLNECSWLIQVVPTVSTGKKVKANQATETHWDSLRSALTIEGGGRLDGRWSEREFFRNRGSWIQDPTAESH